MSTSRVPITLGGNNHSTWMPIAVRQTCAHCKGPLVLPATNIQGRAWCYLCIEPIAEARAEARLMG